MSWFFSKSAAAGVLLLDETGLSGATGAFGLRKLRAAYAGSAIRVRRSSDSTEQDIGFSGNNLDTAALTTFCGAGNGFVVTWYDQSGNARNISQATAANQPQIVASGVVVTGTNGKPAIDFNSISEHNLVGSTTMTSILTTTAFTVWCVFDADTITTTGANIYQNHALWAGDAGGYIGTFLHATSGLGVYNFDDDIRGVYTSGISAGTDYLGEARHESSVIYISKNGGADQSTASGATGSLAYNLIIGAGYASSYYDGKMQELVFYNTALSSGNRTTGRTNINTFYAIF